MLTCIDDAPDALDLALQFRDGRAVGEQARGFAEKLKSAQPVAHLAVGIVSGEGEAGQFIDVPRPHRPSLLGNGLINGVSNAWITQQPVRVDFGGVAIWPVRITGPASGLSAVETAEIFIDNGRHRLAGLLRQCVFSRLAGYEDVNDAERLCCDPVKRRPGRPPNHVVRQYTSFHYRAKSWSKPRPIVAKVEFHPGELFPRVGFIVTNRRLPNERVLAFYNDRGTAEQLIKEGKYALKWTRLSCMRFAANAVRLQLHALACNLANFLRTLATPEAIERWSLTSLRERLIKTGARLVRHGRQPNPFR